MSKYIGEAGLLYLWGKIKAVFATKTEVSAKANSADLASIATSGSYNDLSNKPTVPVIVVCTLAEYNEMASHDSSTYYVIVEQSNS